MKPNLKTSKDIGQSLQRIRPHLRKLLKKRLAAAALDDLESSRLPEVDTGWELFGGSAKKSALEQQLTTSRKPFPTWTGRRLPRF